MHCVMGESKLEREKEEGLVWSSGRVPLAGCPAQQELAGKEGFLLRLVAQRKTHARGEENLSASVAPQTPINALI